MRNYGPRVIDVSKIIFSVEAGEDVEKENHSILFQ